MLALVVLGGAVYFLGGKSSSKTDQCQDSLTQSASMLASGKAAEARSQAVLAMASCSGEGRSKATDLLAASDKALEKVAACERSFRQIGSLIADKRVQRAGSQLDALDTACIESAQGKDLRQRIDEAQATANDAADGVRKHLAEGNLKGALEQLDRLTNSNREHKDLSSLRQEVQGAGAIQMSAQGVDPSSQRATTGTSSTDASESAGQAAAVPQQPAQDDAEKVQAYLHEAESALRQLRFDAAKTAVENARRLDPVNPRAAALLRRIKEREQQQRNE